ncbi:hypothetical protein SAMN05444422_11352 [Halobiforma haloterrestris]|uniref:Uncharacterized protein n=1 Tax=Natronobacterium haloterrestre TaxID=148448 RepID=A0A1I1L4V8_NATHA|nr:hypothetical protein [Halobiforma haloterrestris]SFC65433.1 hypothetical protein SAMN05444422_11352 [Halobiforma haloterrestris]
MDDPDQILDEAEYNLKAAYAGFKQYQSADGEQKLIGLRNAVSFGRSVTFVLQRLRGKTNKDFDSWYTERQEVLKSDEVAQKMDDLRNRILKGSDGPDISNYTKVNRLNTAELSRIMPPWADSAFIGDQYGGSGFKVEQPDGSVEKFYIELPDEIDVETGLYIDDNSDDVHEEIVDAEEELQYYLKLLGEIVRDAKAEFGEE